jgi:hypothetical protein
VSQPQTSGALALAEVEPELDLAPSASPSPEPTPIPASAVTASPPMSDADRERIDTWRALLAKVKPVRPAIAATLELAAPQVVTRERIVLGFEPGSFEDGRAGETDAKTVLTEMAQAFFGTKAPPEVSFDMSARGSKGASVASLDAAKKKAALLEARAQVEKHPLVQKAIAIFEAELKDIKLPAQEE